MKYGKIVEGKFIDRPNRFIAHVEIAGKAETVHVKNTGRCRELLLPGAAVRLEQSDNPARKTLRRTMMWSDRSIPMEIPALISIWKKGSTKYSWK